MNQLENNIGHLFYEYKYSSMYWNNPGSDQYGDRINFLEENDGKGFMTKNIYVLHWIFNRTFCLLMLILCR